ncbi:hypothetical protein TRIATDRAFT_84836 [Trichoderma atroviride IMI 206040]|uniref:Uncharacterized protein n=1 Tax=Hypocrea atroviridis (strain ATCC 20476 / IMI 206040) TaxID=452589 RepID=G9P5Q7_HYPAI|nr:uncharacterized protein TRIATDRAFT_84836 [Trichoderma atroviride IMI 206040]EHK41349.1 hypothetical protein TRIATDRAFT_84836 [Trichoderma atroviride IMI 206040]
MDVPRGSRRTRHAASTASSQEAQLQAQAQLELEAATHRRGHPRRAVQVQVTPDAALAMAAGAHQTPETSNGHDSNHGDHSNHGRREMEPPPNPFRLHRFRWAASASIYKTGEAAEYEHPSPHFGVTCQ